MEHSNNNNIVERLKKAYNVKSLEFRTLDTITEKDISNNDDYLSIMHENINKLQRETYE